MLRIVLTALALTPAAPATAAGPSFVNDVVPVLTRQGCNQGACHGKGAGQNGFKLSLRGYAPDQDHRALTREFDGRRIDPVRPDRSLLLLKAAGGTPHEGGVLFPVGGREYRTLRDWIAAGGPGPDPADPTATKLEVAPADRTLRVGEVARLSAWATFSDGTRRDVTWLTKFDANDPAIVDVTPAGVATARGNGAAPVRAAFQTEVAVATFAVPFDRAVDPARFDARNNFIDDHVFAKLQALRIEPSDSCTDAEFLRRASLDATGTLPTPAEVTAFLANPSADKRAKLVDNLLARPAFVDYWTLFLADLLQNRRERDQDVRGVKGVRQFHAWLREQVAKNRPWDELAREVLTATGDHPAVGYYVVTIGQHKEAEKSEVAESVAQAFLGTRVGCARCHNHPLERFTQDDFYQFAAFFTRVRLDRRDPKSGKGTTLTSDADRKPVGVRQPRTGRFVSARPLDRSAVGIGPGTDPRAALAGWATANDLFAGAMVNRVWRHYMGVGLVEPVDDLRATNPPSNLALRNALVSEFVENGYNWKCLMRAILTSRAYQLSSATRPGNETDGRFYSHYYARRLPAEVLLDAISAATGVPEKFDGYPVGLRAVQVPDPGVSSDFLAMFGRSDRTTACACERGGDVTLPQLLHLRNGGRLGAKLADPDGALAKLLEGDDDAATDGLFLRALGRPPTTAERAAVRAAVSSGDEREAMFRDVFWAVLNAKEFAFNH